MMAKTRLRRSNFSWLAMATAVAAMWLASSTPAFADALGTLSETNCADGGMTFTATTIVWLPPTLGGVAGCINTEIGTHLTYSGGTVLPGATGNILNLTTGGGAVNDFITILGTSLDFVLTGLGPGSSNTNCTGLAPGFSCSVAAGSPFILTNEGGVSTTLSLAAFGTITDGGGTSNWEGAFTTQLTSSAAAIQSAILGGGSIISTQSGVFVVQAGGSSSVPKPGAGGLLLLGMAFLLVVRKA